MSARASVPAPADPTAPQTRGRAHRLDPEVRRGLILDAAEQLFAEGDPLLVTFEDLAHAAGVSRALVHTYLGDRRGLIDAVQVRLIARLDRWVGHGLARATDPLSSLRAMVGGTFSFVEADHDAWSVLVASGGLDHPALHGVRARWTQRLDGGDPAVVAGQSAVLALIGGVGGWVSRGNDPADVQTVLARLLTDEQ